MVQTVFFKIIKYRSQYRAEEGSFVTWMFRIAHNANIDHYHSLKHSRNEIRIDETDVRSDKDPDEAVLTALARTVNDDPNVGVRLMAVNALAHNAAYPRAREALIQSIVRQKSPLVQLVLADVMLALNEKRAVEPIRRIIAGPMVNDSVKSKLETTVRQLL